MNKTLISATAALLLLSACGESETPAEEGGAATEASAESEFDEQLSDEEANAALDELDSLDAEEAEQEE